MNRLLALVVVLAAAIGGYTYVNEQRAAQVARDVAAANATAKAAAEAAAAETAAAEAAAKAAADAAAAEVAAKAAEAEAEAALDAAAAEAATQAAAAEATAKAASEAAAADAAAAAAKAASEAESAATARAVTFVNVHAAIDRSALDAAGKEKLKAAVDAAKNDPAALRAALEAVKAAMALEVQTFVNVDAAIDHTSLDAEAKAALKARVAAARDNPEALRAALEAVKAAIAATPATPATPFVNVEAAIERSALDGAAKQALKEALAAAIGQPEQLRAVLETIKAALAN